jgi:hypothetical protein
VSDTALLVIHGIGEQNPYETIDQAARGFVQLYRAQGHDLVLRPERVRHDEWTEVALHLEFAEPVTERGLRRLSSPSCRRSGGSTSGR